MSHSRLLTFSEYLALFPERLAPSSPATPSLVPLPSQPVHFPWLLAPFADVAERTSQTSPAEGKLSHGAVRLFSALHCQHRLCCHLWLFPQLVANPNGHPKTLTK